MPLIGHLVYLKNKQHQQFLVLDFIDFSVPLTYASVSIPGGVAEITTLSIAKLN
jgi:hypothetical protein